jgi:hypothetical protein
MPYIKKEDREKFDSWELSASGMGELCENAGELNYVITRVCFGYIKKHGMRYQTFNDIMGVLKGVTLEFYRRLIGYYEDIKIFENGDVLTKEEMDMIT